VGGIPWGDSPHGFWIIVALVALFALFGFVRPAMKGVLAPPAPEKGAQLDAVVADNEALPGVQGELAALEAPALTGKLEAARALAKENPAAVANIMRGWVNGEAAA